MSKKLNGAEKMLACLVDAGVEVCFANPGTSEMQMVAALDRVEGMRSILVLFEGVASGAADGYGRMTDKPAATVLHLGPGLSNAMANLHNAQRARSPIVNLIGDHATFHLEYDAPLTSDVEAKALTTSDWVRISTSADSLPQDAIDAVNASMTNNGQVCSLIIPADIAWNPASENPIKNQSQLSKRVPEERIDKIVELLRAGQSNALLLGGRVLREEGLRAAGRIHKATGCRVLNETFPARRLRGAGVFATEAVPYLAELAIPFLKDLDNIILAGSKAPVAFFAYPGLPSQLYPGDTNVPLLADVDEDVTSALIALAEALDATEDAEPHPRFSPPAPAGSLCPKGVAAVIAELMPEDTIISEEAATGSFAFYPITRGAARHEVLTLTGGSLGQGLPVAIGAALACPDRKVLCLHGDGGAMYTLQSLWTIAREQLDVTVVIYKNNSYAILNLELHRTGAVGKGEKARSVLTLDEPTLDWVNLAEGMGVKAGSANTVNGFRSLFAEAMVQKGPRLIEAALAEVDLLAAMQEMLKDED